MLQYCPLCFVFYFYLFNTNFVLFFLCIVNDIGDGIASVLFSRGVDREFLSDRIKPRTIKLVFTTCISSIHAASMRNNKDWFWLGFKILCPSARTGLSADCYFSELHFLNYKYPSERLVLVHDITEILLIFAFNNNHLITVHYNCNF